MQLSNLTICYEGILRVYRNAVVAKIREAFTAHYPDDYNQRLRLQIGAEEWRKLEENCYRTRISGQLTSSVADDFDLLGVNHFFNVFEKHFEKIFPVPENADKVEKRADRKRVLEWTRTVKELRDPAAHPTEEDFSYEDAFVLLDCARRVLIQLKLHEPAREIKNLTTRLSGQGHILGEPLEAMLPPSESIVCDFVGREAELAVLWDWVANPTTRRWALSGAGGKGKTAIAYRLALDVRDKAPGTLQVVLWLSAKKRRFSEGETVAVPTPDFENLDSALNQILFQYGWIEEVSNGTEAKRARVLDLCDEFPALIVVDDIDTLDSTDEDVIEFFSFTVPQTASKVLLTSRRVIWGMANTTTQVEGFSASDVGRFITSRCQLFGMDRKIFDSSLVSEIRRVTEGSPLYIEDLMRLICVMPPAAATKAWGEKQGQAARQYALGRELEQLTREARQVLIAACFYSASVSFAELKAITGLGDSALMDSLSQLQGLFLVPKPTLIEGEARFEINVNIRTLVRETERKSEFYRSIEAAFKSVSGALPRVGRGDIAALIRQAVLLVKNGEEQQAEALLLRALEIYPNDPDLMGVLGFVYRRMQPPRYTDARAYFQRSHQLNSKTDEMYKHWAKMEMDLREWTKAAEAAESGLLKRPNSKQLAYLAGFARSRLGQEMTARVQHVSAKTEQIRSLDHFNRALDIVSSSAEDQELNALIYRGLAISAFELSDRDRVKSAFARWRRDFPGDPNLATEWDRISTKMGFIGDEIRPSDVARSAAL